MEYDKKTAVFKEIEKGYSKDGKPVGGIIRIEIQSGVADLYLSLINFSRKDGEFLLFVLDGKGKVCTFSLGSYPTSLISSLPFLIDLEGGFSASVCFIKEDLPLTVAFCKSEDNSFSLSHHKKIVANFMISKKKEKELAIAQTEVRKAEQTLKLDTDNAPYNDEAVATENYFEFEKELKDKLKKIEDFDNERISLKNETAFNESKKEENQAQPSNKCAQNEESVDIGKEYSDKNPYINSVKLELDTLFLSHPTNERLQKTLADGKFINIFYSQDKHYTVGVIKENGKEKYICYGVPATYSPTPPKELKGYCSFIPLSVFDLKGEGYWMIFQDAITGECIKQN